MAARPGEDLAATLYADVHYYYGPPTAKPPHHRFDKESYVYLFENASQKRARLEIANSAGTPDQDAFNGHMDGTHVRYSYRHPCLVTLTVDGPNGQPNGSGSVDAQEWQLPAFDPQNEQKYLYRLHTLDIYFWTKEDAQKFFGGIRRVLATQQVTVVDEPVQTDEVSSVVQNLENVAIAQGDVRHSRNTSISSSVHGPQAAAIHLNRDANRSSTSSGSLHGLPQQPAGFAPLAYNPAAPAAPEAIMHREKTPPPEDGVANPLVAAANSDQGQVIGGRYPGGFSGPPPSALSPQQPTFLSGIPGQIPSSLQSQPQAQSPFAQHFQNRFDPPPTTATVSPPAYQAVAPAQPASAQTYPASPGAAVHVPSFPLASVAAENPDLYNPVVPPPGGFAEHDYNPGLSSTKPLMTDYSIHHQVYRPTEGEAKVKARPTKPPKGNLERRAAVVEMGVNGLLKKLEKKIG